MKSNTPPSTTQTSNSRFSRAELTNDLLSLPVQGLHLAGPRFEDNLHPKGTLLVFLRHLGCTLCRQTVADLRTHVAASASRPPDLAFPDVVLIYQGTVAEGEEFFAKHWPEARAIADRDRHLYAAFGIKRGTAKQLVGPQALIQGLNGLLEGHGLGIPIGDPLLMPGMFFIKNREVYWEHDYEHIGDHPDYSLLPELLQAIKD